MDVGMAQNMEDEVERYAIVLLDYCRRNDWAGFDPYDALNSRIFLRTPFFKSKLCRIFLTQIMKRLPVNFRSYLAVTREQNPKALGLFLAACIKLSRLGLLESNDLIDTMTENIAALRSKDTSYWCWGYNFPWQTRTILVPRGAPNLVCTIFVGNALLDAYEAYGVKHCLEMATGAAEYILNELYRTDGESMAGFSYPLPSSKAQVHNANFLGAAFLCRVFRHGGNEGFRGAAMKATRYSSGRQKDDGSWAYGEQSTQRWVDNFHTGFNLCALRSIGRDLGTAEFESNIHRGFAFYRRHFFREDNAPKYFHDRVYPIDIHSAAQSIVTLLELKDLDENNIELAHSVFRWVTHNMWDERGYFYYRVTPFFKNKISYMRWSQSWMLLAISALLENSYKATEPRAGTDNHKNAV